MRWHRVAAVLALLAGMGDLQLCAQVAPGRVHPIPVTQAQAADPAFCYQCHADKNGKHIHTAISSGSCTSCHVFFGDGSDTRVRLTATGNELCLQCHAEKDGAHAKGAFHAPKENCTSCHDPHSSAFKYQLKKAVAGASANNLCANCHNEADEPPSGGSRHAVLDIGCDTCHTVHKSGAPGKKDSDFFLTKTAPALCRDCHAESDPKINAAHQNQPTAGTDCTRCHDPHRSSAGKLLYANAHDPFVKNQCDKCHAAAKDDRVVLVEGSQRALCYNCHDRIKAQVENSKTKHPVPFLTETCTDCHDPHASRYASLLRKPEGQVCGTCHEKSALPVQHGPYAKGQCTQCHDPHGANEPKLLRTKANNLCRACHVLGQTGVRADDHTVVFPWNVKLTRTEFDLAPKLGLDPSGDTGHPIAGHPMTGVNSVAKEKGAMSCASCHQAHSSKANNLLPNAVNDSIQLCEQCHK